MKIFFILIAMIALEIHVLKLIKLYNLNVGISFTSITSDKVVKGNLTKAYYYVQMT